MVNILRVKARWSGFSGAPGFSVLHFRDFGTGEGGGSDPTAEQAVAAATKVRTFFDTIKLRIPQGVSIQIEPDVEMIEDTTGDLVDSFTAGTQAIVDGGATGSSYSGATGAVVNFRTGSIKNGRRIRGRLFLVPLASNVFAEGVINPGILPDFQAAADALVDSTGSPDLGVYSRPSSTAATDGRWVIATSANVPNLSAVLRSRRD